jgi:hypothetical protein
LFSTQITPERKRELAKYHSINSKKKKKKKKNSSSRTAGFPQIHEQQGKKKPTQAFLGKPTQKN